MALTVTGLVLVLIPATTIVAAEAVSGADGAGLSSASADPVAGEQSVRADQVALRAGAIARPPTLGAGRSQPGPAPTPTTSPSPSPTPTGPAASQQPSPAKDRDTSQPAEREAEQQAPAPAEPAGDSIWDRLAACESGGRWSLTGGLYEGGLQFHPDTWQRLAPADYPDSAASASREQEISVAKTLKQLQGWGAWPACARQLGLR